MSIFTILTFTTGDEADLAAPATPVGRLGSFTESTIEVCGQVAQYLTNEVIFTRSDDTTRFLLRVERGTVFMSQSWLVGSGQEQKIPVAVKCNGECDQDGIAVLLVAIDAAGNESEPLTLTVQPDVVNKNNGCSTSDNQQNLTAVALLAIGLNLTRRRNRHRS
jgi:hypothetical protein